MREFKGRARGEGEPGPKTECSWREKLPRLSMQEHLDRTCPICRKLCKSERGRDEHMRNVHKAINVNPEFKF